MAFFTSSSLPEPLPRGGEAFRPTRWSLVKRAAFRGGGDDPGMEEFCRIYWYPLYAAARRQGQGPEDACDAVQTLFMTLVEKETLRRADPERGRLRSFLLTLLQNQMRGGARAARAQKRGGGRAVFSLDCAGAGAAWEADPALRMREDPASALNRGLAAALLDEAVEALAASYRGRGKEELFLALLPSLEGPLPDTTYQELAERFDCGGGALRMAAVRLRERFRKVLRAKAAFALGTPDGPLLDAELRELFCGPL